MTCPHCWEKITLVIDLSIPAQDYVEDCFVCCRPIRVNYTAEAGVLSGINVESAAG